MTVSLLTERRSTQPEGLHGGESGKSGKQTRIQPGGGGEILPSAITYQALAGEILKIETPGGGGWGGARPEV
jgi:N-methylhydantoinase B/oxoprolinase/acetone carboxylase alpha subunit